MKKQKPIEYIPVFITDSFGKKKIGYYEKKNNIFVKEVKEN